MTKEEILKEKITGLKLKKYLMKNDFDEISVFLEELVKSRKKSNKIEDSIVEASEEFGLNRDYIREELGYFI